MNDSIKGNTRKEVIVSALDYINVSVKAARFLICLREIRSSTALVFKETHSFQQTLHMDMPSIILDVYNILDIETSESDDRLTERENLAFFVKHTEKVIIVG